MKHLPHLFVGGSVDGLTLDVPVDMEVYRSPIKRTVTAYPAPSFQKPEIIELEDQTDTYRRATIRFGQLDQDIFMHDQIRIEEVLIKLLENYKS